LLARYHFKNYHYQDIKEIDLGRENLELSKIFSFSRNKPVLLVTGNSEEFIIRKADDFKVEVGALRNSESF